MKKIIALILTVLLCAGIASAQHGGHNCGNCQHHQQHQRQQKPAALQYNADGIETTIVTAFPTVKTVKKQDKWTEVYDGDSKLLGYAVYSKPASDGIKGFAGETPVLIALDAKKVIKGVYMLPNSETPGFEAIDSKPSTVLRALDVRCFFSPSNPDSFISTKALFNAYSGLQRSKRVIPIMLSHSFTNR